MTTTNPQDGFDSTAAGAAAGAATPALFFLGALLALRRSHRHPLLSA